MEQRYTQTAPSLATTVIDVFASPSDAFTSIHDSVPSPSLWLIPMVCAFLLFACHTILVFTDHGLKAEFIDSQVKILHHKVKEGTITKVDADKAESNINSMSDTMMVFTIAGGCITIPLFYFGCAFILWLTSKLVMGSSVFYIKYLELFGMTTWINILGRIFSIALMMAFGTFTATPSAALAVIGHYDSASVVHKILTGLNIFAFWENIVIGIGLGVISGKSSAMGIMIVFVLWALWIGASVLLGFAR